MPNFTKAAIKASFLKLLNAYPLNKITVRSIVEDCGINRNSFYYHYPDIPALLEEIIREEADALIAAYSSISSMDQCAELAFQFALKNRKAVLHIYQSVNRDVYERYSLALCEYVITTYFNTVYGAAEPVDQTRELAVRFFKCTLFGLMIDWISGGMREDVTEEIGRMTQLCREISAGMLRRAEKPDSGDTAG